MRLSPFLLCALALAAPSGAAAASGEVSEIVVTGAPYAVSLDSVTTSVEVLTREALETAPPAGLGDMLKAMPGLRSSTFGPGASRPIIRGLSGPRVMILQNGVGLIDASTLSPDHAVASEPAQATRIEVLRGPATLAYGGSAIGGVVNVLDDRIASSAADGLSGGASLSAGSVDDSHAAALGLKVGRGPWTATLDAARRESGDYAVPADPVSQAYAAASALTPLGDRRVRNSDLTLEDWGGGLSYVGGQGYLGVSAKRTTTRYGLPYPQVSGPAPEEGPVYIDLEQTRLDLRGEAARDLGQFDRVRLSLGHADYEHAEIERASGAVGARFRSNGTEGRLELVQRQRAGWQGAVGVQGLQRELQAIGDEAFIPATRISEAAAFVLQRLDRGGWGVEGGLRIERRDLRARLAERSTSEAAAAYGLDWSSARSDPAFNDVSGSAAAFWRPRPDLFLGLSVARNRRAPTEFELFADGPHAGTGAYEIGDPSLKSEQATSVEATWRWTPGRGRLEAHVYHARYDGYIEQAPNGDRVGDDGAFDVAGELPVFRFTQTDARFTGAEVEATYRLWDAEARSLHLEGAVDTVRATAGVGRLARIPPWSATARLVWDSPRVEASSEVRHVARQDRLAAFETPTDAYTTLDAKLSFRPSPQRDLRLYVEGRNLTDEAVREHVSFLKDIAPQPGRSIRAGMAFNF
ncbi:MAG: TonB-dependent receptor [Phenylobacterium sp.]|uniref:TonB-dependent receptor n=1 Tax=Phenylobacterium sp. TaxID=1871053 RepID=UPI0027360DA3|nr:TonB-dependent receptor [Phenylobacterium sp.]MDP3175766.1 TonB-dependent receptor [Phenylobacterium sp.]